MGSEGMTQREEWPARAPQPSIAAIVLAAGRSARMGQAKLLLPLGDRPLVAHAVAAAQASVAEPVIAVLGYEAERVRGALPPARLLIVENPRYAEGLATSLRAGLAAVPPRCAGALVLLCDQPLITAALVNRLLAAARQDGQDARAILAASYAGRRGHPVYFPRLYFDALAAVEGDEGGRGVLAQYADRVRLIECADVGQELDVDTLDDYERVRRRWDEWQAGARP
jgi:molybdenum cofactor cytidylyltransferase